MSGEKLFLGPLALDLKSNNPNQFVLISLFKAREGKWPKSRLGSATVFVSQIMENSFLGDSMPRVKLVSMMLMNDVKMLMLK